MSFGGKRPEKQDTKIDCGDFPMLSTAEFRQLRRISFVFDEGSLAAAIEIASDEVRRQLKARNVTDIGNKVALYKRAVYSLAHADLLPEFATQNRRDEAENTAEDAGIQGDRMRAQSNRDINQVIAISGNSIWLI